MLNHVRPWLYFGDESRPFKVLDRLLGLYVSNMIVRSLAGCHYTCALINYTVLLLEYDGSDEYENLTPTMVTIVMLLNDMPHVWHRLVANLVMNSYN